MSVVPTDPPAGYSFLHVVTMGSRCFIRTSGGINEFMKVHITNLVEHALQRLGKRLNETKIAVMDLLIKRTSMVLRSSLTTETIGIMQIQL